MDWIYCTFRYFKVSENKLMNKLGKLLHKNHFLSDMNLKQKRLIVLNLVLGLFLWFLFLTDFSLTGNYADILYPPFVCIISLISYKTINARDKHQQRLVRLTHLPSIIGGGWYLLVGFIMLIPPFTLGAMFAASEIKDETQIQAAISPDKSRTAYVYFRGVGAYSGGNGRVYVRVRHQLLPFVERDIYSFPKSYASEDSIDYLEWRGDNAIYISEIDSEISVGVIKAEIPAIIMVPTYVILFLYKTVEQSI